MAEVEFAYEAPEISDDGSTVTWQWSVVNNLPGAVSKVVMTHHVSPALPIERATSPSEVAGNVIKTRWQTLAAGEVAKGEIVGKLPEDLSGSVAIAGRIVWETA